MTAHHHLSAYLQAADALYNPDARMLRITWQGPGYHTRIPNGQPAHPTRETLDYLLALLYSGEPARIERAREILPAILELQDRNPCSATYGIWPWLGDEPLAQMAPPDWNWADFCGIRLAHILVRYRHLLPEALQSDTLAAMEAAAYSIFRRNVGPDYTNIAIKGAVMTGVAGECLTNPFLIHYAEQRLTSFLKHFEKNGGIAEYNSPAYGMLVLHETERGLLLLQTPVLREQMIRVHGICWELFSQMLHLPTGQLCGPQSRAYQDLLSTNLAENLAERLNFPMYQGNNAPENKTLPEPWFLIPPVPCPENIRQRILKEPEDFERHDHVRAALPDDCRSSAVWRTKSACLGSINHDSFWVQRRPILGYWRTGEEIATLRVRMQHSRNDFASGVIRTVQSGNSILAIASIVTNKGDHHDHLDAPADGIFQVTDLALSIELDAPDAMIQTDGEKGFLLSSGEWTVWVQPLLARFGEETVHWETAESPRKVKARGVINGGREFPLQPATLSECAIGFYLELFPRQEHHSKTQFVTRCVERHVQIENTDGTLSLTAPSHPSTMK